jgi:hypothetical protein
MAEALEFLHTPGKSSKALLSLRNELNIKLLTWAAHPGHQINHNFLPNEIKLGGKKLYDLLDYAGGPFVRVIIASHELDRKTPSCDILHLTDPTYGGFVTRGKLILTVWGYCTWKKSPMWNSQRFSFPFSIPATLAGLEFHTMNRLAMNKATAIISLLPKSYLPRAWNNERIFYIPPPLSLTDIPSPDGSDGSVFGELKVKINSDSPIFIFASRDLSIKGKGACLAVPSVF